MESGHSMLECDSMHAAIERARTHVKVYDPEEYCLLMQLARKNPQPYMVKKWTYDMFYNIRELTSKLMVNRTTNTERERVHWLLIKHFQFRRGTLNVYFKYDPRNEYFFQLDVTMQRSQINLNNIASYVLQATAYPDRLPISTGKKQDLMSLLRKGIIPKTKESFYASLPSKKGVKDVALWVEPNAEEEETIILGLLDINADDGNN